MYTTEIENYIQSQLSQVESENKKVLFIYSWKNDKRVGPISWIWELHEGWKGVNAETDPGEGGDLFSISLDQIYVDEYLIDAVYIKMTYDDDTWYDVI